MSETRVVARRANPYFLTLVTTGAIVLAIGLVALFVGVANASSAARTDAELGSDTGAGELTFGSPVVILGGLLLASGLIAGGVDWSIGRRARPDYRER